MATGEHTHFTSLVEWVLKAVQKSGSVIDIVKFALDAGRFVTAFSLSSASRSTPHIYISALPFWPETRPIRERYWKRTQGLIRALADSVRFGSAEKPTVIM